MKAKKSFGQHFLKSEQIARRIAESLRPEAAFRHVLEVGPGKGMLTKYLLEGNYELKVVEADRDMVRYLHTHFPSLEERLIESDILEVDFAAVFGGQPFGLIGNYPYNISSQILFHMIRFRDYIPEMVGMFQKEVAERIVAGPGSKTYGIISVLIQAYYEGEYLFGVDKKKFAPPPKVQSAVIRLTRKENTSLGCDETLFRRVVKQAFSQRRKMLRNTMKSFLKDDPLLRDDFFTQRPERLSVADFIYLTREIESRR